MVVIVDYKLGNLGSIRNMFKRIGADSVVTSDPEVIALAERLILPGVGAFGEGMDNIARLGLREVLDDKARQEQVPVLGICLGMQLMTRGSEEADVPGLGWVDAETVRFRFAPEAPEAPAAPQEPEVPAVRENRTPRVPHIGWNTVDIARADTLFRGLDQDEDTAFYFVHSYHVICHDEADVLARTTHGYAFASALQHGNVMGTQFHPEKSHRFGMRLLKNFVGCA